VAAKGKPLLYGANGKPIRSAAGWDASTRGTRATHWRPTQESINSLLSAEGSTLRSRSRDEFRRNAWAASASQTRVASLVGNGIRPKPDTEDDDFRAHILDAWNEWIDECDADGTSSFYGLQALTARGSFEGGDGLIRFRPRRADDGLAIPLQLQALEAEMLDHTKNLSLGNGGVIRAGVEFGPFGKRVAYWLFRDHPGEAVRYKTESASVRIPAEQVIHVFHVTRAGQVRGIPGLATVLAMLHEIREVDDAHVLKYKIQNLYASFEEVPSPDSDSVLDLEVDPDLDEDDVSTVTAKGGSHVLLPPGHTIKFGDPPRSSSDYADFIRTKLRAVAAGCGVTYEQISGDLTGVNFSSIRAGLIEFRREMDQVQNNVLVFQLCRPVWRRFFETGVLSGRIVVPAAERARMPKLLRAAWQPPGWEYVEPEKDIRAAVRRIRAGLSSRTIEAAKRGLDVEELDRQIAADNERAAALGLTLDSDPGSDSDGGARAAALTDPGAGDGGEAPSGSDTGESGGGGEPGVAGEAAA